MSGSDSIGMFRITFPACSCISHSSKALNEAGERRDHVPEEHNEKIMECRQELFVPNTFQHWEIIIFHFGFGFSRNTTLYLQANS